MTRLLIVAAAVTLNGCMSLTSAASSASMSATQSRCSPEEAAALPEGSRIQLTSEWIVDGVVSDQTHRTQRIGTVLKASPEGVALVNCSVEQRSSVENSILHKTPYLSRLHRNTGIGRSTIPVVWVPLEEMGSVRLLENPPAEYVSTGIHIDTTRHDFFERIGVDFDFNLSGSAEPGDFLELVETSSGQISTRPYVRASHRSVVERVVDDPGCFSGNSPRRIIELVDPQTGEVIQRKVVFYDDQGSHVIEDTSGGRANVTSASFKETVQTEQGPGVQSLGRDMSGHGPATPDPGTARID